VKRIAIIVAGGKGVRLGTEIPKQFLILENKPVVFYTIEQFVGITDSIILVLPRTHMAYWGHLMDEYQPSFKVKLVAGGETRSQSVLHGLAAVEESGLVAIHDAVRPLVSQNLIIHLFQVAEAKGSAIPVLPVRDSLRYRKGEKSYAANREEFVVVQTPQVFTIRELKSAYEGIGTRTFTDDAGVYESAGKQVEMVEGEQANIKITFPEDLLLAGAILRSRTL
jgi:2-C-methyl-D-erythritol 4-phosphate cytidylyltransferase